MYVEGLNERFAGEFAKEFAIEDCVLLQASPTKMLDSDSNGEEGLEDPSSSE